MCVYCKGDVKPSETTFTVQVKDSIIVIKNVPCEECTQCGETFISDSTMCMLETIVDKFRDLMQEVAVIDYRNVA